MSIKALILVYCFNYLNVNLSRLENKKNKMEEIAIILYNTNSSVSVFSEDMRIFSCHM